jgi:hypothetical protein
MSLAVSNTTTKRGLVQFYEKEIGANYGDISGNADKLAEFIARANVALDNYLLIWAKNAGTWQADDLNQTDFQATTLNLVSGTREYAVTADANSNKIVEIMKVLILPSATATAYQEINPIDELDTNSNDILLNTTQGIPTQYGKAGKYLLLDAIPNYSATNGIKVVVGREGSYVTTADTTKVIGVPAFHEYFYLKPAYEYARINNLAILPSLEKAIVDLEGNERLGITGKIAEFFSKREKDVRKVMKPNITNFI